jgi:hypothetical protein
VEEVTGSLLYRGPLSTAAAVAMHV